MSTKHLTIFQLTEMFPYAAAERAFGATRWPDGVKCPRCNSGKLRVAPSHPTMSYYWNPCRRYVSDKTGSLKQSSNLGYRVWACCIFCCPSPRLLRRHRPKKPRKSRGQRHLEAMRPYRLSYRNRDAGLPSSSASLVFPALEHDLTSRFLCFRFVFARAGDPGPQEDHGAEGEGEGEVGLQAPAEVAPASNTAVDRHAVFERDLAISFSFAGGPPGSRIDQEHRSRAGREGEGEDREQRRMDRRPPAGFRQSGVGGSGLGLAICNGIVEAHGVRIWAESDGPELGARFTFTLPAAGRSATPVPGPASDGSTRNPRVRVLVVDDNPHDLRYVRDVLTRAGYATVATGDPADVPRLMEEEKPHLALLDLVVPGSDCIELMNDIRKTEDVPVISLSVYGQDETVARALDMGAADYLVKPSGPYDAEGLSIDYALRQVTLEGEPVELTATEYAVLYELTVHAPRTLTHAVLLQRVWGPERVGEPWLVRDMVRRLRRKLGDDADNPRYVITEPRVGYRMATRETRNEQ